MKKAEILDLYIKDLESHVPKSEARDNRIRTLKEELDKELTTSSVSYRRELLKAYDRWDEENCYKLRHLNLMQRIHIFLEAFNCG